MSPRARRRRAGALLLTPGAGGGRDQDQLVAIDELLTPQGWVVERMDLPRTTRAPALVKAIRERAEALAAAAGVRQEQVHLGGRSMGGRMCSMAVAEGLPAAGLVLISYPLHPPGRPDKQPERTAHLPRLHVPCLFVSGTRDPFGTPAELQAATASIPGPVTHEWIDGGDHGLRGRCVPVASRVGVWVTQAR